MLDPKLLQNNVLLLEDPMPWATRYSSEVSISTPLFIEFGADGKARLLDIMGGIDPDWTDPADLGIVNSKDSPYGYAKPFAWDEVVGHLRSGDPAKAMSVLIADMARFDEDWSTLMWSVQRSRYSSSAWFERDIRQVGLTDELTGKDIITLEGEELDDAITMGLLTPPRHPRPSDSDWLNPLMEYALYTQIIESPDDIQSRLQRAARQAHRAQSQSGSQA